MGFITLEPSQVQKTDWRFFFRKLLLRKFGTERKNSSAGFGAPHHQTVALSQDESHVSGTVSGNSGNLTHFLAMRF